MSSFFTARGWTLNSLLAQSPNFLAVPRVAISDENLLITLRDYERDSVPLIIDGLHQTQNWKKDIFTADWFKEHGPPYVQTRNIRNRFDAEMPTPEFVEYLRRISSHCIPGENERLYGKDVVCPLQWNEWLHQSGVIPRLLLPDGPDNLMLNLPQAARVETLMCYLGIGDTLTPCHKDLCASSGQNLMCYTENDGSSFWFMTSGSDAADVAAYFQSLGHELDHESHTISVENLAKAPFKIYIAEQCLGDLVLVPPRSCHQVVNSGGITIKTSWSRMTLKGLAIALYHELPVYRRVCRPEIYRIKATIHHTLLKKVSDLDWASNKLTMTAAINPSVPESCDSTKALHSCSSLAETPFKLKELCASVADDIANLIQLFQSVLAEEFCDDWPSLTRLAPTMPQNEMANIRPQYEIPDGYLTCDFCGADIFQSYFGCATCVTDATREHGHGVFICPGCYVEGRSCSCRVMNPGQVFSFHELHHDLAVSKEILQSYNSQWRTTTAAPLDVPVTGVEVFKAACILHHTRKHNRHDSRRCRFRSGRESHEVPKNDSLYCKQCHASRCFSHLLDDHKVHSSQALIFCAEDPTHQLFHDAHRFTSKDDYQEAIQTLSRAAKEGSIPPPIPQVTELALTYRMCLPISTHSMIGGFYDATSDVGTACDSDSDPLLPPDCGATSKCSPTAEFDSPPHVPAADIQSRSEDVMRPNPRRGAFEGVSVPTLKDIYKASSKGKIVGGSSPSAGALSASKSKVPHSSAKGSSGFISAPKASPESRLFIDQSQRRKQVLRNLHFKKIIPRSLVSSDPPTPSHQDDAANSLDPRMAELSAQHPDSSVQDQHANASSARNVPAGIPLIVAPNSSCDVPLRLGQSLPMHASVDSHRLVTDVSSSVTGEALEILTPLSSLGVAAYSRNAPSALPPPSLFNRGPPTPSWGLTSTTHDVEHNFRSQPRGRSHQYQHIQGPANPRHWTHQLHVSRGPSNVERSGNSGRPYGRPFWRGHSYNTPNQPRHQYPVYNEGPRTEVSPNRASSRMDPMSNIHEQPEYTSDRRSGPTEDALFLAQSSDGRHCHYNSPGRRVNDFVGYPGQRQMRTGERQPRFSSDVGSSVHHGAPIQRRRTDSNETFSEHQDPHHRLPST